VHAGVAGERHAVEHLLGPVLVVRRGKERLVVQQLAAVGVRVDVCRIRHVVAGALEPSDEIDLPVDKESEARVRQRPIEGHLDGSRLPGDRVRPVAAVVIEALARAAVVGIVVVRLVGGDR
jgi:hypothetical protein